MNDHLLIFGGSFKQLLRGHQSIFLLFSLVLVLTMLNASAQQSSSQFGATVELDQKVYTWTDKVYITIVAPDFNINKNLKDSIGYDLKAPITISTREHSLTQYRLIETGTDTGIFTGEIILTGLLYDADGNPSTGYKGYDTDPRTGDIEGKNISGLGPTNGFLESDELDGITVSFEFSEDETVVGSALIRWNIGELQWLEASYPASGTGVIRVIDPDMNLDPEAVENFDVDVWSDSDAGGIDLTVTETNEATGIFEGTVFFTITDESSGHRLRVAEGDTVTAEYEDNTLPDPYTTADELDLTATAIIDESSIEESSKWSLEEIQAFTLNIQNNEGIIIDFHESFDDNFSTINQFEERLKNIGFPSNRYQIETIPKYENNQAVLTKQITIDILDNAEFNKIFYKDPLLLPIKLPNTTIDQKYAEQYVISKLESCSQNPNPNFCNLDFETLLEQIFNKNGKHVITESLVLGPKATDSTSGEKGSSFASTITQTSQTMDPIKNSMLDTSHPLSIFLAPDFPMKESILQQALAQSSNSASVSIPTGTSVPGCEITKECFIPFEVKIGIGGEVTWSNDDTAAHTVTGGNPSNGPSGVFDSSLFMAQTTYTQKFETEGEFPYFCMVHPWMRGIVKVSQDIVPRETSGNFDNEKLSEEFRYLNGFTLGYGFGKTWTYEFDSWGLNILFVEAHAEAGLGIGLRIPIDLKIEMEKNSVQGSTGNNLYDATYTINTSDIALSEYRELGLPFGQGFEGKEFNAYLGPAAEMEIRLFDVPAFSVSKGVQKPESNDFKPPLGSDKVEFTELNVDLLCDVGSVCIPSYMAEIELSAGVRSDLEGEKITMESTPNSHPQNSQKISFFNIDESRNSNSPITDSGNVINNVKYYSVIHLIPQFNIGLESPVLPFSVDETLDVIDIEFPDIILESHDNTEDSYEIPEEMSTGNHLMQVTGTNFRIEYQIKGGHLVSITPDVDANSLIMPINANENGHIKVILPRELIDAKNGGNDDQFFVLVNGEEIEYGETHTISDRTLVIPFPSYVEDIEIIGTHVIPEFGPMTLMILVVSILSIITIMTKSKLTIRY